jgi:hypothetical protein
MYCKTGTFTGTGVARTISVGWEPDLVIVGDPTATSFYMHSSAMLTDEYAGISGVATYATDSTVIPSLTSDGFNLGTSISINTNGTAYWWVAIKNESNDFATVRWTGNNNDNRAFTGIGFQPDYILVCTDAAAEFDRAFHEDVVGEASGSFNFTGLFTSWLSNYIQTSDADGFTVGTLLNATGSKYVAFCFKASTDSVETITYVGDGLGDRVIALARNSTPAAVLQQSRNILTPTFSLGGIWRTDQHTGDGQSIGAFGPSTQSIHSFGIAKYTVDTLHNNVDYNFYSIMFFLRDPTTSWRSSTATSIAGQGGNRGSGLYPFVTGNPGSYEFHKTIRKAMRQLNNLTLGD